MCFVSNINPHFQFVFQFLHNTFSFLKYTTHNYRHNKNTHSLNQCGDYQTIYIHLRLYHDGPRAIQVAVQLYLFELVWMFGCQNSPMKNHRFKTSQSIHHTNEIQIAEVYKNIHEIPKFNTGVIFDAVGDVESYTLDIHFSITFATK